MTNIHVPESMHSHVHGQHFFSAYPYRKEAGHVLCYRLLPRRLHIVAHAIFSLRLRLSEY